VRTLVIITNRFCSVHGEWFSKLKFCMDLYNLSADTGIVASWLHVVSWLSVTIVLPYSVQPVRKVTNRVSDREE